MKHLRVGHVEEIRGDGGVPPPQWLRPVADAERVFVGLAAGTMGREEFVARVAAHIERKK